MTKTATGRIVYRDDEPVSLWPLRPAAGETYEQAAAARRWLACRRILDVRSQG